MMRAAAIAVLVFGLTVGCSPDATPTDVAPDAPAYASPPVALRVLDDGSGTITVQGLAGPDERVRLIQMNGIAHGVTADSAGAFTISVPGSVDADRLFNLSVERAGQSVSSDGWLYSPASAPERSVMLRVGGASLPVGDAPLLAVVDMDGGGGVALAGRTEPDATVRVAVDGQSVGSAKAGTDGRWFMVLSAAISPGSHQLSATVGDHREQRDVNLIFVRPTGPLEATTVDGATRVAWALPGGGSQATWILLP